MKIKFSDKVSKRYTKEHLFKQHNFRFHINQAPGCFMTFYNMERKYATEHAIKNAPGCTFTVEQFG